MKNDNLLHKLFVTLLVVCMALAVHAQNRDRIYDMSYDVRKDAAVMQAWSHLYNKDTQKAAFQEFTKLAADGNPEGYNGLVYYYIYVDFNLDKAFENADMAIKYSGGDPRYIDTKGELYTWSGDFKKAKEFFCKINRRFPNYYNKDGDTMLRRIIKARIDIEAENDSSSSALLYGRPYIQGIYKEKNPIVLQCRAYERIEEFDFRDGKDKEVALWALKGIDQAIQMTDSISHLLDTKGLLYSKQGNYIEAKKIYDKINEKDPTFYFLNTTKLSEYIDSKGIRIRLKDRNIRINDDASGATYYENNLCDHVEPFYEGLAAVQVDRLNPYHKPKWGFLDEKGALRISFKEEYDAVKRFSEGWGAVEKSGVWWFIDAQNNKMLEQTFEDVGYFSGGYAPVKVGGKWGYINKQGKYKIPPTFDTASSIEHGVAKVTKDGKSSTLFFFDNKQEFMKYAKMPQLESYTDYVKPKVEEAINAWQKKGEFETSASWQKRVNEDTRAAKVKELIDKYASEYQTYKNKYEWRYSEFSKAYYQLKADVERDKIYNADFTLNPYDTDHESFMVSGASMDILLSVGIADAPTFKQNWETIKKTAEPEFVPNGDDLALVSVTFHNGLKAFTYDGSTNVKYAMTDVDYNFKPLDVSLENANLELAFDPIQEQKQSVVSTTPKDLRNNSAVVEHNTVRAVGMSDVDDNIPTMSEANERTFAVVIGNEEYQKVANVPFAANDAKVFGEYCQKTLGLPSNNVRYYSNATYANLLSAVDDIENISKAYNGDINVIFYYAGHGVPDEKTSKGYLLPTDADGRNMEVCYPLSRLYSELGSMGARTVVVFMDACFSGGQRGGGMLASARGVALKAKADKPKGNMVVFAAAKGDETAYPYTEQGHGLFTYYLLKILQETKGKATLKQLEEYVTTNVRQQSVVVNKKAQTPSVMSSVSNGSNWGDWKLR